MKTILNLKEYGVAELSYSECQLINGGSILYEGLGWLARKLVYGLEWILENAPNDLPTMKK